MHATGCIIAEPIGGVRTDAAYFHQNPPISVKTKFEFSSNSSLLFNEIKPAGARFNGEKKVRAHDFQLPGMATWRQILLGTECLIARKGEPLWRDKQQGWSAVGKIKTTGKPGRWGRGITTESMKKRGREFPGPVE